MRRSRNLAMVLAAAALAACGSEIEAACERADECNLLRGRSAEECTQAEERRAENLNDGQAADLYTMLDACLDWESCEAFRECINDVNGFDVDD